MSNLAHRIFFSDNQKGRISMNATIAQQKIRLDEKATNATRRRYERLAPFYDRMEKSSEGRYTPFRERVWSLVEGPKALEVGVGTGKNIPFYPYGVQVTAIDLAPGMLNRAKQRAEELGKQVDLRLGDVQCLEFPDATFDTVAATFVFCSVPDPILGLREVFRVLKPGGKVVFMEHVRSEKLLLGLLMEILNPFMLIMMGSNMNRRTVDNVRQSGFVIDTVENLRRDYVKLIVARR